MIRKTIFLHFHFLHTLIVCIRNCIWLCFCFLDFYVFVSITVYKNSISGKFLHLRLNVINIYKNDMPRWLFMYIILHAMSKKTHVLYTYRNCLASSGWHTDLTKKYCVVKTHWLVLDEDRWNWAKLLSYFKILTAHQCN